ncbi:HrgA protein, partial [Helicobacter bizzozeronii]|uniref:HrgA protein n=1 Tax=Helicobacter bizzozeronii TaxID=56877 RepID=UPI002556838A
MKSEYIDAIVEVLKEAQRPLKVLEIFKRANQLCGEGKINDPLVVKKFSKDAPGFHTDLMESLRRESGSTLPFRQVAENPILIALNEIADTADFQVPCTQETYLERTLHPLLAYFAFWEFELHTQTIYHERAQKSAKGMDMELYPDMVGVRFAYKSFNSILREVVANVDKVPIQLVSFDLKK